MNENEEKVVLPFRPEITLTIEKKTLQKFFDGLADKIAGRTAVSASRVSDLSSRKGACDLPVCFQALP